MTTTTFLASHERLIAFSEKEGWDVVSSHPLKTIAQALDFLEGQESIFKIVRFNTLSLESQDITEQLAAAYIDLHCYDLDEDDPIDPYIEHKMKPMS